MHLERSLVPVACFFCAALSAPATADMVPFNNAEVIDLRPEGSGLVNDEGSIPLETSSEAAESGQRTQADSESSRIPEPNSLVLLGLASGASLAARAIRRARNRHVA